MERMMLKPQEVADAIGMGRTNLYKLIKAGVIPSCRVGKSIRIPAPQFREWVLKQGQPESVVVKHPSRNRAAEQVSR